MGDHVHGRVPGRFGRISPANVGAALRRFPFFPASRDAAGLRPEALTPPHGSGP